MTQQSASEEQHEGTLGSQPAPLPTSFPQKRVSVEDILSYQPESDFDRGSLASLAIKAHGLETEGEVVYVHNYLSASGNAESIFPFHLTPYPELDFPMAYLAVANSGAGESILTLKLPNGMKEYYLERGLLDPSTELVEIAANTGPGGEVGFPYADVTSQALAAGIDLHGKTVVMTFPSQYATAQLESLGASTIQHSDPFLSNNKAALHEAAEKYGFKMTPWQQLESEADITAAAELFKDVERVWVKLAHGAGGDNVLPISAPVTEEKLKVAVEKMKASTAACFEASNYGAGAAEEYWPEESFGPKLGSLFVEADASVYGHVIQNLTNLMIVNADGSIEVGAYYKQFVSEEGEFLGGEPVALKPALAEKFQATMEAIGAYYHDMGYRGLVSVDGFVTQDAVSGELDLAILEVNGRPGSCSNSHLVAAKLGFKHWINAELKYSEDLGSFDEALAALEKAGVTATEESAEVVPLCLGCLVGEEGEVIYPSKKLRVLIGSNESQESCHYALSKLRKAGFSA